MEIKEKPSSELLLVFTFVDFGKYNLSDIFENRNSLHKPKTIDSCRLISANVGKLINNQFILVDSLKINSNLTCMCYKSEQIKNFELFCNDRWNNKGLLLLDKHEENNMIILFAELLLLAYRKYNDQITRIICGISPKEEYLKYQERMKKAEQLKKFDTLSKKKSLIEIWDTY